MYPLVTNNIELMQELIELTCTTIGYMLKVFKNKIQLDEFNNEFKMIRHGDYFGFINSIKGEVPFSVVYHNGIITADSIAKEDDVDFIALFNAGPSMKIFYEKCFKRYGRIDDHDISNAIYGKAALFEISLKMHANNNNLIKPKEKLVHIIDKLGQFKGFTTDEIKKLHQGRRFLNMIKHPKEQFSTWQEGIDALSIAYDILKINRLSIL